jgi:hypothetical protein
LIETTAAWKAVQTAEMWAEMWAALMADQWAFESVCWRVGGRDGVLVVCSDARKVDEKVLRMAASWVLWWVELTVRRWVGRLVACSELLRTVPRAAMKAGKEAKKALKAAAAETPVLPESAEATTATEKKGRKKDSELYTPEQLAVVKAERAAKRAAKKAANEDSGNTTDASESSKTKID